MEVPYHLNAHISQVLDWMSEHWPLLMIMAGMAMGSAWYSLHKVFATKKSHILLKDELDASVEDLKTDFATSLRQHELREDIKNELWRKEDEIRHESIGEDIRLLVSKLIPERDK